MKTTIAELAKVLALAVQNGHGELDVTVSLIVPRTIMEPEKAEPADEPVEIAPVPVVRDDMGYWRHPAMPASWDMPMGSWLKRRGFTYTITLLVEPAGWVSRGIVRDNIAAHQLRRPTGSSWFLWEINVNADGTAVAVWIAPTK